MADGNFPTLVSSDRDPNAAGNPIFTQLSDGTAVLGTTSGALNVNVDNTVTVSATNLDIRDLTSASDSVEVLQATHDNLNGNANIQVGNVDVGAANPVPVSIVSIAVTNEVHDYDTAVAVAGDASDTHTYTVTATKTLLLKQILVGSSGGSRFEIEVDGATVFTGFIVKQGGFESIPLSIAAEAGTDVTVIRKNMQGAAQDLYSTIIGEEV